LDRAGEGAEVLADAVLGVGRQVARHAARAWLDVRRDRAERDAELIDLVAVSVRDQFHRRRLARQFDDLGDHVAERLRPLAEREFADLPDNERQAAIDAVTDALMEADLSDRALFDADADPARLARLVRDRVPHAAGRAGLSEPAARLHDMVLDEACVCLARIVEQLPAFEPRALGELLGRTSRLSDDIGQVLQRLPRASLDAPRGSEHDAQFRNRYLGHLSDTLDEVELFGINTRRYRPRTRVSVAYLSLEATADDETQPGRPREGGWDEGWLPGRGGRDRGGSQRVEAAVGRGPRTLLRGEAGSGKTTLLAWLAVNAARGAFTGPLAAWNGHVPFLVRLRSHADRPLPRPEQLLDEAAAPLAGLMPPGWAHRQLSAGAALLLVDGVDELPKAKRAQVRRWLRGMLAVYPEVKAVVTSRPAAADRRWLAAEGFAHVLLEPMTALDITSFCRRWHEAVRDAGRRDPAALPCPLEQVADYEAAVLRHLDTHRHLRSLATNPLLCALICALNLDKHRQLPPDRMRLYADALDLLIERRDAEREVPAARELVLDPSTKMAILQSVAWAASLAGRAEMARADMVEQAGRAIARMPNVDADAESALEYLLERSGVIREPVVGRIDFVHRTFQEYLAAKQAAEDLPASALTSHAHLDQWRETVVMAAGHGSPSYRSTLLAGLLDRADAEPRHARRLRLLAAACLDTAHILDPEVAERVEAACRELFPPRARREVRSLALAGDRALRHLPASLDGLTDAAAVACVRTAALVNGRGALHLLARYATDPRSEVQYELAEVWKYFDAAEYAQTVLATAPLDSGHTLITHRHHLEHLQHLEHLSSISLWLPDDMIDDLSFLPAIPHLTHALIFTGAPVDLAPVARCGELVELVVVGDTRAGFDALAALDRLVTLSLRLGPDVRDVQFVRPLPHLEDLSLLGCEEVSEFEPILEMRRLRSLGLGEAAIEGGVAWLQPWLPQLEDLSLPGCPSVSDLDPLRGSRLRTLNVSGAEVADISPIADVPQLERLNLGGTQVSDLTPLTTLRHLKNLNLFGCPDGLDLSPLAYPARRLEIVVARRQEVRGADSLGPRVRLRCL
jgi:hypothetical protein